MKKNHWHYLIAYVVGGVTFPMAWGFIRSLVKR